MPELLWCGNVSSSRSRIRYLAGVERTPRWAEGLHILDEHIEGLGEPGSGMFLALEDGLVDLTRPEDCSGLMEGLLEGRKRRSRPRGPTTPYRRRLAPETAPCARRRWVIIELGARDREWIFRRNEVEELQDVGP